MEQGEDKSHSLVIGYILWIVGFIGVHRFYYGKPISGTLYFLTLGLLGVGWLVDLFLIPSLCRQADIRFHSGEVDFNLAWILLAFLGLFGVHRMYIGKWPSGILYLLTLALFGIGIIYDLWTLNEQISLINGEKNR